MSDLTLEENIGFAAIRAKELAAERHFFDAAPPFFPLGFSVGYRNPGHWDIYATCTPGKASAWRHAHPTGSTTERDSERERAFRIRGTIPEVLVMDERWNPYRPHPRETLKFRSVIGAMLWIIEELMQEPRSEDAQ